MGHKWFLDHKVFVVVLERDQCETFFLVVCLGIAIKCIETPYENPIRETQSSNSHLHLEIIQCRCFVMDVFCG